MNAKKFSYSLIIKEGHLDTFGHVNNARYLDLLEEARWELMEQGGYGLEKIRASGLGPIVLEINIKYSKELRARESITIETEVIDYRSKIGIMQQNIMRKGISCAPATIKFALFDLNARKIVAPTPDWLQALGIDN